MTNEMFSRLRTSLQQMSTRLDDGIEFLILLFFKDYLSRQKHPLEESLSFYQSLDGQFDADLETGKIHSVSDMSEAIAEFKEKIRPYNDLLTIIHTRLAQLNINPDTITSTGEDNEFTIW